MYRITKLFIGGTLKGLTYTEVTSVSYPLGFVCKRPIGGSPYEVIKVERV